MKLELSIETDNDAFVNHAGYECARILDTLNDRLRTGSELIQGESFTLCDYNGNTVGRATVSDN